MLEPSEVCSAVFTSQEAELTLPKKKPRVSRVTLGQASATDGKELSSIRTMYLGQLHALQSGKATNDKV